MVIMARTTRGPVQQVHISLNLGHGDMPLTLLDSGTGQGRQRIKPRHGSRTTRQKRSWDSISDSSDHGSMSRKRGMGDLGLLGILIGAVDRVTRMWVNMPRK